MKILYLFFLLLSVISFVYTASNKDGNGSSLSRSKLLLKSEANESSQCSICHRSTELNDFYRSGCSHEYHARCLNDYFRNRASTLLHSDDCSSCKIFEKEKGYVEFIVILFSKDFSDEIRYIPGLLPDISRTIIWTAILKLSTPLKLRNALKYGMPTNMLKEKSGNPIDFLCLAAEYASPANLSFIISSFKSLDLQKGFKYAIMRLNLTNAKIFLQLGADINFSYGKTDQQFALLLITIWRGPMIATKFLIENNANVNLALPNDGGSPLHLAVHKDNVEVAELLIKSGKVDFNAVNSFNDNHVMYAVRLGKLKTLAYLLDIGAPSKLTNFSGFSLLHYAVIEAPLESVQFLLKRRFQAITEHGEISYLLHLATVKDRIETVNYLLRYTAANFYEICHPTILGTVMGMLKDKAYKFHPTDPAIVVAMLRGNFELFKVFLDNGVCPNTRIFISTRSLLHLAFGLGNVQMAHYLISIGADLSSLDSQGLGPRSYNTDAFFHSVLDYSD